jgi:enolase
MGVITKVAAEEILDSRGIPTVKTTVFLEDGSKGIYSVPSGTSTGKNEAVELRDGDKNRYGGQGVLKAVENVNGSILKVLKGVNADNQEELDQILLNLDGTKNKSRLGANAILSVSAATAVATAVGQNTPLYKYLAAVYGLGDGTFKTPLPLVNLIEGGAHARGGLEFQEFLVVPKNGNSTRERMEKIKKLTTVLEDLIKAKGENGRMGMEGGFDIEELNDEDAIKIIKEAVEKTDAAFEIGLDIAASTFYKNGSYKVGRLGKNLDTNEFILYLIGLCKKYNLFLLEDPLYEEDWGGWSKLTEGLVSPLVVADDLVTTNPTRLKKAISEKAATGVVVKPNQIGTLSETMKFISDARKANLKTIVAHRSGETKDTFIVDLAVGTGADFIKTGAPTQPERSVKYDRLIEIERELGGT